MENRIIPLSITPSDMLEKFLLPVPASKGAIALEILVPGDRGLLQPGFTTNIPLNWNCRPTHSQIFQFQFP